MPHCIVEYSQELAQEIDINELMSNVFKGAVKSLLFSSTDIKVRAIPYNHFYTENTAQGANSQQRFIHICCKILSGRTLDQRNNLSKTILSQLTIFAASSVSISVEIVNIERESYHKYIS